MHVSELLETPRGRDEYGTPDHALERCEDHDVLYRVGGACLRCEEVA